jgi:hypothetical protein
MKTYHSIEKNVQDYIGQHVFGFDKIDGSNFCAEWNRKLSKKSQFTNGFKKFGTRTETIKNANNPFTEAIDIFEDKYSEALDKIFCENKLFRGIDTITVYGEFAGESSFAGKHIWDEDHDVTIFDMFMYKKDFVKPADFIDIFGHLDVQKLVLQGLLDVKMIQDIISNKYGLKEGVVLKGVSEGKVWMVKVKTQEWLNKIRALYGENNNIE